jgi:hypothetical protein
MGEVKSGLGKEGIDGAGPVLHRFEPGLDQRVSTRHAVACRTGGHRPAADPAAGGQGHNDWYGKGS